MINTSALNGEIDLTLTGRDKNFQVVLYTRAREMYFYILYDETKERKKKRKKKNSPQCNQLNLQHIFPVTAALINGARRIRVTSKLHNVIEG